LSSEKPQSRVIWFAASPQQHHRQLFEKISARGIAVEFVETLEALELSLQHKRSSVILLSDQGDDLFVEAQFRKIIALPDTAGIRLILDQSGNKKPLLELALLNGFRDILPSTLSESEWIDRFLFSAAVSPFRFTNPKYQLSVNSPGFVDVPACITSLSPHQIRIETRLDPEIGTELNLRGELPTALGKEFVTVKVVSKDQGHLNYRFSQALNLEIVLDDQSRSELEHFIARFQAYQLTTPKRVFMVMSDPLERSKLIEFYASGEHIVRTAISRTSVFEYPKYFSPELVLIELKFCVGTNLSLFEKMLASLETGVLVVIFGKDPDQLDLIPIQENFPSLRFIKTEFAQADLASFIELLAPKTQTPGFVEIPLYHTLTSGQIRVAVQLTKLHPQVGELRSQIKIANFSLARLNTQDLSDSLGYSPIIKTTSSSLIPTSTLNNDKAVFKTLFYYCDINLDGRKALNTLLLRHFLSELEKFGGISEDLLSRFNPPALTLVDETEQPKEEAIVAIPPEIEFRAPQQKSVLTSWFLIAVGILIFGLFIWMAMNLGYTQMEKVGEKYSQPFINFKNLKDRQKRGEPPPIPPVPESEEPPTPENSPSENPNNEPIESPNTKIDAERPRSNPPSETSPPKPRAPAVFIPRPPPPRLVEPPPPSGNEPLPPDIDLEIPEAESEN